MDRVEALEAQGYTVMYVAEGETLVGLIAVADLLRPEVSEALDRLRAHGIRRFLLLIGDNERVARALAAQLGVNYRAECLPVEKIAIIKQLQAEAAIVAMLGDGINDAPVLAQADIGIAMGAVGTDAALEAAHVALMQGDWCLLPEAVAIGRRAFMTIKQNLWFTVVYNVIGILQAATGRSRPSDIGALVCRRAGRLGWPGCRASQSYPHWAAPARPRGRGDGRLCPPPTNTQ
jgi:Cu+-exporting ATPase